jgi:hypothetical protein
MFNIFIHGIQSLRIFLEKKVKNKEVCKEGGEYVVVKK